MIASQDQLPPMSRVSIRLAWNSETNYWFSVGKYANSRPMETLWSTSGPPKLLLDTTTTKGPPPLASKIQMKRHTQPRLCCRLKSRQLETALAPTCSTFRTLTLPTIHSPWTSTGTLLQPWAPSPSLYYQQLPSQSISEPCCSKLSPKLNKW